jgi:hypothetical protein
MQTNEDRATWITVGHTDDGVPVRIAAIAERDGNRRVRIGDEERLMSPGEELTGPSGGSRWRLIMGDPRAGKGLSGC